MSSQEDKAKLLNSLSLSGEQRAPKKSSRLYRFVMSVVLLQAGFFFYFLFSQPAVSTPQASVGEKQVLSIEVDKTLREKIIQLPKSEPKQSKTKLEAQGFATAVRVATVSSRVLGVVKGIKVEEGDKVKKGQVLAYLDDSHSQVELKLAKASLSAIKARIKSAKIKVKGGSLDLERVTDLFNDGYASQELLDKKQNTLDMSAVSIDLLMVELDIAKLRVQQQMSVLDDHVIRAPFSGVVVATSAQVGEVIAPSGAGGGFTRTGICTIIDMNSLEVVVEINEQLISKINLGQSVEVRAFAYRDALIRGRVEKILPRANLARGTVEVRIGLLEKDERILPDMGVRVGFL
jgi:RND family efflux transporter MFP subunit